jgi:hypothetical protein
MAPAALKPVEWHAHEMSQRPDSALSKMSKMSTVSSSTFGTGKHPMRTPYPPLGGTRTPDEEDGDRIDDDQDMYDDGYGYGGQGERDEWSSGNHDRNRNTTSAFGVGGEAYKPKRRTLTKRKSLLGGLAKTDLAPNLGGSMEALPNGRPARRSEPEYTSTAGSSSLPLSRQDTETSLQPEPLRPQRPRRGTGGRFAFLSNKSRRPEGPATPVPFQTPQVQGEANANANTLAQKTGDLVDQARSVAGIKTKAERRRDDLKNKIRIVTPSPGKKGGDWF